MTNTTAGVIIGGIAVATVAIGIASIAAWSIVPISVWTMTTAVIGSQSMNILRIKNGQLQPPSGNVVPLRKHG